MITSNNPAWSKVLAKPAREFPLTPLPLISGEIPPQLTGTLYRNGPARLSRGSQKVGHWFDGDGAILAVNFAEGQATATYRYAQTTGYQAETKAERYLYANYGMSAPGGFWNNWLKGTKNSANTSVLPLSDRLLALWEGGKPYALDLDSLETKGIDNLGDTLETSFSAHPKVDPDTGEIYNFGVTPGKPTKLYLYRCAPTGRIIRQNSIDLSGCPLIHDFVLTQKYLVFLISPVRINLVPVILGIKCFSDAMQWQPQLGTQVLICDRENLSVVSQEITEPWYQWHFSNGYEDQDGEIAIEFVRYDDFATNQYLKEVASSQTKTLAKGRLWYVKINPQTGRVTKNAQLLDLHCEFPIVASHQVSKLWRYSYFLTHGSGVMSEQEFFNAIACFDRETGNVTIADMGMHIYPSEAIYVSQPGNLETGWLLSVVYDGNSDHSEVRIYQGDRLEANPLCRLALPSTIPHSFHGIWQENFESRK
ncbi:lignostilbene-alpha,beta-dioxygenase-like enzyme [Xenococcus sp. PCC 7305]|uniref:carotenoid oxygenase family protein n=1 Tax=Xenococcus sp. PCC 7305 TaxID=102125 RepID=UPI0002ACDA5F|nr:carotenoid oxygenase family protein [Xenococcus sp. PCC 7305]ELS02007.1 lignostilbene-alpha,beta-dioxygenase-like enzyme [Xenococcus sp. PCC 7305]